MVAPVELLEVDQVGVCLLRPSSRRLVQLAREDADSRWNGDPFGIEEVKRVLPSRAGQRRLLVFVTQVRVMLSSTSSRVRLPTGSPLKALAISR